jgi:trimethyllysine dioxygenase
MQVSIRNDEVVLEGGLTVPGRWLRDHGDDPESLNPDTSQRKVDTFAINPEVTPASLAVADGWLQVDWSDGATTGHHLDRLIRVASAPRRPAVRETKGFTLDPSLELWSDPPPVRWFDAEVINDDGAWVEALDHLRRFGWVAFDGSELGDEPLMRLVARIGYPRRSIFGDVWNMTSGASEHLDSAYETVALDVHTDGTYSHDAPGTIVFAQQIKTGEGGDSVLVDAFAAARDFQQLDPDGADLLTRYAVRGHYIEPGVYLAAERPPLRVGPDGVLEQVSFNNYDRSAVLPEAELVDAVLDAYAGYRAVFSNPARAIRIPWQPGRLLVVDNWRCFHGRTEFTGDRSFRGCYTNHEDLEGAYRIAGLIPQV